MQRTKGGLMARERITISVQQSLVSRIDALIDKKEIRNRSHAIESILNKSLNDHHVTEAVLCVGGPKAAQIAAKIPHVYPQLLLAGITTLWFILGEQSDGIQDLLKLDTNLSLHISIHLTKNGSGGGLGEIIENLKSRFLVVNTDDPSFMDIPTLEMFHQRFNPIVSLQQTGSSSLQGVSIVSQNIRPFIGHGFSLLEQDIFPKVGAENQLLIVPPSLSHS